MNTPMSYRILLLSIFVLLLQAPQTAGAAVAPVQQEQISKAEQRALRKAERRQKRFERRMERLEKRIAKKEKEANIWTLLIGIGLFAGGVILGILAFANPSWGGFIYFLAGLMIAGGLVNIIYWIRYRKK